MEANYNKSVGIWLLTCAGLVGGMVVIGGLTRLTKSGLSMTDWKFHGGFPPLTEENWLKEFEKYKLYPEFKRINQDMTVSQFKTIYFWEYGHRMYGRFIGFAFTLPLVYFAARGGISSQLYKRLGVLFVLGAGQGVVGWWMVKSGLQQEGNGTYNDLPRVSPYRMAAHLAFAFVLYWGLLYTGMQAYSQRNAIKRLLTELEIKSTQGAGTNYRMSVYGVTFVTLATAIMGAFVAGNDAGFVYNDWPKMGVGYVPSDLINPYIEPKWRNLFENSTMIQFAHRNLAYGTVLASAVLFLYSKRLDKLGMITKNVYHASGGLMTISLLQSVLGIFTLIHEIPISLASMHQAGSLSVMASAIYLLFLSRKSGYGASQKLMTQLKRNGKPSFLIV